jgi:hypothetical protein
MESTRLSMISDVLAAIGSVSYIRWCRIAQTRLDLGFASTSRVHAGGW